MTAPVDEVVEFVSALIRFDTSNTGEPATTKGEADCARWVAEQPGRSGMTRNTSSPVRRAGATSSSVFRRAQQSRRARQPRPTESRRAADPRPSRRRSGRGRRLECAPVFRGGVRRLRMGPRRSGHEGHVRDDAGRRPPFQASRHRPARDLVFAFVADEEHGGKYGAHWLVEHRPDLFEGVTEAVGEVGGFSITVPHKDGGERRLYLIETAEKGLLWMRLTARAGPGTAR